MQKNNELHRDLKTCQQQLNEWKRKSEIYKNKYEFIMKNSNINDHGDHLKCTVCNQLKIRSDFTKNMRKKRNESKRKCISCVTSTGDMNEKYSNCSQCHSTLKEENYGKKRC